MKKKIIVKISEGLGNQLFMYANAFALSKKNNFDLLIDPFSGYFKTKNMYLFFLNRFKITSNTATPNFIFANHYRNLIKKLLIFSDNFIKKKKFFFENKSSDKSTAFSPLDLSNANNYFFLDGNFESEKYFMDYRNELLNEFKIINEDFFYKNKFFKLIKDNNVVSISIRQNRFSERIKNKSNYESIIKSKKFVDDTVSYIYRSISYFNNKITNPKYLIWSNDFTGLEKYFDKSKFFFVENKNDKVLKDFFLLTQCKYFIVGPTSFHWWGAWLSEHKDKICLRPKNLNPSKNVDYWPESWISI